MEINDLACSDAFAVVFVARGFWRNDWSGGFVSAAQNYRGDLALHGDFSPPHDPAVIGGVMLSLDPRLETVVCWIIHSIANVLVIPWHANIATVLKIAINNL
jgi:hypothetical protein